MVKRADIWEISMEPLPVTLKMNLEEEEEGENINGSSLTWFTDLTIYKIMKAYWWKLKKTLKHWIGIGKW